MLLNRHKNIEKFFSSHQRAFQEDEEKQVLGVQSQNAYIHNFFLQKVLSVNSFEKRNLCLSLFIAKDTELLIFMGDLAIKL